MRKAALALVAASWAHAAGAQAFPARSGESGLLDVPSADVAAVGDGAFAAELRYDDRSGSDPTFGPLPLYAGFGVATRTELGLSMREGGQPGDPVPARTHFGAALKLQLVDGSRAFFSMASDLYADRLGGDAVGGGRLVLSTTRRLPLRLAAYAGWELGRDPGATYGGALALAVTGLTTTVVEALDGPRGANFGISLQRRFFGKVPLSLGVNWFPGDNAYRVSLGVAFAPARKAPPPVEAAPAPEAEAGPVVAGAEPPPVEGGPRFRLKLRLPDPSATEPRTLRHGPWVASGPAAGARPGAAPGASPGLRSVIPSLEDLADAQLREQEALAETRQGRVRAASEQLDARDRALQDETRRLADRERDLAAREQQLDARERRLGRTGAPAQPERDLEAQEAQLAAQERNLASQERSFGPAVDAAQGRERDAAAREDGERVEASRLAAAVSGAGTRPQQLDVRKQALGARNRQLSAAETRLVARGERIDALERQARARGERLDAWQRRLDARGERLDLVEKRAAEPRSAAPARAAEAKPALAAKDKGIFVMVVKAPTAIVKERAGVPAAGAAAGGAVQTGAAVEKAVAAATVVAFASPADQLSELDRETIDNIAKLAARERCELLIWARAKDPSLMAEAQRRVTEIRTHVLAVAPLSEKQIVTRITTRPGATGVDVVVSALREMRPAAPAVPAAPATGRPAGLLEAGEGGKRQVREAIQAAQPSIEACVGDMMEQRRLARAEGSLKLTISAAGRVAKVVSGDGDLAGAGVGECLSAASGAWIFPPADAEYVVEVPITVIRGGAR